MRTRYVVFLSVAIGTVTALVAALLLGPQGIGLQFAILNPLQIDLSSGSLLLALSFAFIAGVSMILTPCGYPLVIALTGASAKSTARSWLHSLPPFSVGIVGAMAIVGVFVSLMGRFVLNTILDANLVSRVLLSALVYGGLGIIAIFIGLRSLGFLVSLPSFPGLESISQLFSTRAMQVEGFDRRMLAFGALYGGGMAAGCPVPYYWAILLWVAISGNPLLGALVLGVHALGYAVPVLTIVILSRLGITVIKSVPKTGERLQNFVSAGMLTAGTFLFAIYIIIRISSLLVK